MTRRKHISAKSALVRCACAALLLPCAFSSMALTVRSKSDMRVWETVMDRTAPLSWPWEDGADSATLVFSNRLSGAVLPVEVVRNVGEARGRLAQPAPVSGDSLVDVSLAQKAGGVEIARDSAVLAYVGGAGGGPVDLRVKGTAGWRRVRNPRVFAFDPAWLGRNGESGYDIAQPYDPGVKIRIR